MDSVLYDLMDWERIESIVYSDNDAPGKFLGTRVVKNGVLIQAFFPETKEVYVQSIKDKKTYKMFLVDEAGFYAVLIRNKELFDYKYIVTYQTDITAELYDPYMFDSVFTRLDLQKFNAGMHYHIYEKLGAHLINLNGVWGVNFAVWAPNAVRVSVVGDFNMWDGRRHPMNRLENSGVFELFIPELDENELYKFEIKIKGDLTMLKADPYANEAQLRPDTASIVAKKDVFQWNDDNWLNERKQTKHTQKPMNIYEIHLGSFRKPKDSREFYNYRELAPMIAEYVKEMNYTHIELLPIMEHPLDASWGYQVTGYYAPTKRYGTPEDFRYFMNYMHENGIGVILDWVPAHFPKDAFGLANFDGTCLYEHLDPRQGCHPHWGTLIYNYGRPEVSNFLIANVVYWLNEFHVDGIRVDAVASMLYLDYGKSSGEWIPNMYGGNENLEAIELLKQLNHIIASRKDGSFIIAEESTAWPMVTGDIDKNGLGFQYKWNMGWMNDFLDYMRTDPLFRKGKHGKLLFSMIYAYSEKFILVLSHDEVVHMKGSLLEKMPGERTDKFANLRVCYGFMIAHPGKKLLFMGQEFGQPSEWNEQKELEWNLLESDKEHMNMRCYVKSLNQFYKENEALYKMDYVEEGFEWTSCLDADHSVVAFLRKTDKIEETLLFVFNFTPVSYDNFLVGVPFKGKYKEIFNSDKVEFGGQGYVNPRVKQSKAVEHDGRSESIKIKLPPLGFAAFTCVPIEVDVCETKIKKEENIPVKKKAKRGIIRRKKK